MSVLAIDLGSSSARIMQVEKTGAGFEVSELARFAHSAYKTDGGYRWDIENLFKSVVSAIDKAIDKGNVKSVGICSWGVDYGLINCGGRLYDMPYCYRDARGGVAFELLHKVISQKELYLRTGVYPNPINTVYQLYADKLSGRGQAEELKFAMIADLLAARLTGKVAVEKTNASTTGLMQPCGEDWDWALIDRLGLKKSLFAPLIKVGERYGQYRGVPIVAVCTHDTASAVYSLGRLNDDTAFVSSGSWLLFGAAVENIVANDNAFGRGYTNERGFDNILLLNNINGLYVIQKLQKELNVSYDDIDKNMDGATSLGIVDMDKLVAPGGLKDAVLKLLEKTDAKPFDIIKTVYDSLAQRLKIALTDLEELTGNKIDKLVMTGGATKAPYLRKQIEERCKARLICVAGEGAVLGNAMAQFAALEKNN